MFSTSSTNSKAPTKAAGVTVQTSIEGKPIAIVYGRQRVSPNLLWKGDFKAIKHTSNMGGGSGGDSTVNSYTYTVSFLMGICEGPVEVVQIYKGSKKQTKARAGCIFKLGGTNNETPWGYLETNHASKAVYYPRIAYAAWANRNLGSSATLPNYSFEVDGFCQTVSGKYDCDPSVVIKNYLTNEYYGCGLTASNIASLTTYSNWCLANGLLISVVFNERQAAREALENIIDMTCAAPVWSGGKLKIIPYGDVKVTGNGAVYTPPDWTGITLTNDDFKPLGDNQGPVRIKRKNRADIYNVVQVEGTRRSRSYNSHVEEAHDALSIQTWGYRPEEVQQAHFFPTIVAMRRAARLRLERISIAETYEFKLGWEFIGLEPMDVVALTDPLVDLDSQFVRITEISEDSEGYLSITAEEVLDDSLYASSAPNDLVEATDEGEDAEGFEGGDADDPGSVNAPVIFEPPAELTQGAPTVYFSVSGAADDWGGAEVWYSLDEDTYSYAGTVGSVRGGENVLGSPGRQGVTAGSAAFPAGSDPDTVNSVAIDMSLSGEEITAASQDQADAHESLSYLGGELIAHTVATLQEDGTYLLGTYIRRGLYGSAISEHAVGSQFCTLQSDGMASYTYPTKWIGKTIHFKFRSFDIYGDQLQDLDDCTAYSLAITGASYNYVTESSVDAIEESVTTLSTDVATISTALAGHVANVSNPHAVTKAHTGLGDCDNTSDADKPISTATQTALDLKAPLASPPLTGTPTAPTAATGTNTTQIATTAFVLANAGSGGAARGFFSGVMSEDIPTQLLTGLTTWVNQGSATVADTTAGLTLYCASNGAADSLRMLVKDVPATPYTVTVLLGRTSLSQAYPAAMFGWRNSANGKLQVFTHSGASGANYLYLQNWSAYNAFAANVVTNAIGSPWIWLRLADDGTTVTFSFSFDGNNFLPFYSIAKASGYLGSTGYNQILFGVNPYNYPVYATIMSYAEA